jgi:uncharacterized protein (TIGR02268 family)
MLATLPLLSILFASTPGLGALQAPPRCEAAPTAVELRAEPVEGLPVLCISPGVVTSLLFDAPLLPGAVALLPQEPEVKVAQGGPLVSLLPSSRMVPGEWRKLTVRFGDGAAPASATLLLYVHPVLAARQVEVRRQVRTVDSYQREVEVRTEALQRCQEENTQLRAAAGRPDGLRGLLSAALIDRAGIVPVDLLKPRRVTLRQGSALVPQRLGSYRSSTRVAVELTLTLPPGALPWQAEGARLTDAQGRELPVLPLWQGESPEGPGLLVLVVEAPAERGEAQGAYTLKLWEAEGSRGLTVEGIVFPQLPAE